MPFNSGYVYSERPPHEGGLTSLAEAAKGLRTAGYKRYGYYTLRPGQAPDTPYKDQDFHGHQRFAEYSNPDIEKANTMGRQTHISAPYLAEAAHWNREAADARFNPKNVQEYMSPYQEHVVQRALALRDKAFKEEMLPQLAHQYAGNGIFNSGAYQANVDKLNDRFQQEQREAAIKGMAEYYNPALTHALKEHELSRAAKGESAERQARLAPLAEAGNIADITRLREQGQEQRNYEQMKRDMAYNDFQKESNYPHEAMAQEAGILHGFPTQAIGAYTAEQTQPRAHPNAVGALSSLGGSLAGAAMMGGYGRKAGGPIKRAAGGLSRLPLMESTLARKPKPGGSLGVKHAKNKDAMHNAKSGGYIK